MTPLSTSPTALSTDGIQAIIIDLLGKDGIIASTKTLCALYNIDNNALFGALKSLASYEKITYEPIESVECVLTQEGRDICQLGSHEYRVLKYVMDSMPNGIAPSELQSLMGVESSKIGQSICFKNKWIKLSNGLLHASSDASDIYEDTTSSFLSKFPLSLQSLSLSDQKVLTEFRKRKLIDIIKVISYSVAKGSKFGIELEKPFLELTSQMIISGTWKERPFKPYNFDADGPKQPCGHLHPLLKVRNEFRNIFFEMGFTEMSTDRYVESSFWNFDALFVPQQHPARDSQDTFFVADPACSTHLPMEFVDNVKKIHSEGGYGSLGYRTPWSIDETHKNVLRTHTTACSARMLYALAKEPKFRPVKLFSIDKVFRNESVDATHLAEFHQIEGLIADYNLTLSDLMGVLHAFFSKLGMSNLKFKPAYNPYTEPSMEIFSFHEGLDKWIEVGNSGIFRPEMLRPMGFDDSISVIAWGLSLERPTMIKYHINNIRDLVGHKVDLNMIYNNPICQLDKVQ